MKIFRVAIIGAGPAGIACAIQLKRYDISFVLFEKDKTGGLLRNASLVENYPGFPQGIKGERLVSLFRKHLKVNKIDPVIENVELVDYEKKFMIRTNRKVYHSEILVIASGTKPKQLDSKIPEDVESKIFYEIVSLKNIKNAKIGIIGAGDAGFDYSLSLSKKNRIFLINRSQIHRCLPLLFKRVIKNKNINYIKGYDVKEIKGEDSGLILYSQKDKAIHVDYLVVAIGREPNLHFLGKRLQCIMKILEKNKKLYMIGDVKNGLLRQTAIAVGDGIRAGMEISKISSVENRGLIYQT